MKNQIALNTIDENTRNFVIDTWIRSYRKSPYSKGIPTQIYYPYQRAIIESLIDQSQTLVASNINDEDQLIGYICFEKTTPPILHYLYVKKIFRRLGVAKQMLKQIDQGDLLLYSHKTHIFSCLLKDSYAFHPYKQFERKQNDIQQSKDLPTTPYRGWVQGYANHI